MTIYWISFLSLIGALFVAGETYALTHGTMTLSRFTWNLSKTWPPLPWVVGLLTGFVACHFWWGGSLICY